MHRDYGALDLIIVLYARSVYWVCLFLLNIAHFYPNSVLSVSEIYISALTTDLYLDKYINMDENYCLTKETITSTRNQDRGLSLADNSLVKRGTA